MLAEEEAEPETGSAPVAWGGTDPAYLSQTQEGMGYHYSKDGPLAGGA